MNTAFKILIVDDEVLIAEFLKDVLLELGYRAMDMAHSKTQALLKIQGFVPDLVLLDIRMRDEFEGIEVAELINEKYKLPFIYITAQSDIDIIQKALSTKPAGYITKPFKKADVYAAIRLVEEERSNAERYFVFKDGYDTVKLPLGEILYAQSSGNYVDVFCTTKKYTLRNTIEWLSENIPGELFKRVHRSYIVNISKLTRTSAKSVFINELEIPVSRSYKSSLE
jgi:two-component system response regulator LytT